MEERRALNNEYRAVLNEEQEVEFTVLEAECEFGKDVTLQTKIHNKGKEQKKIRGNIFCQAVTYTERYEKWFISARIKLEQVLSLVLQLLYFFIVSFLTLKGSCRSHDNDC